MNSQNFWHQKRCLITGGAGFLGQKLTSRLLQLGAMTRVIRSQSFNLLSDKETDQAFRQSWLNDYPEIVFHLAATVGGIGATNAHAGKYFYDNMVMGLNVVEACRIFNVEKLVVAGSVCAYPEYSPTPMIEENLWSGKPEPTNAPYGISKRAILAMQQAYHIEYGMKSAHILQANLYGPGDDFSDETAHVIPALIKRFYNAMLNDEPEVVVWGTGKVTRDFLFADDAVEAYVLAAENLEDPFNPINIGTGIASTISFIAEKIKKCTGYNGKIIYDNTKPDGQLRRQLGVKRAEYDLSWKSTTSIKDGLAKTVAWYIENEA